MWSPPKIATTCGSDCSTRLMFWKMASAVPWYQGTADAIFQNINLVEQSDPHVVAIFGGDHIYRMNIASMIDFHMARHAQVTVAANPFPQEHAAEFGRSEERRVGKECRSRWSP